MGAGNGGGGGLGFEPRCPGSSEPRCLVWPREEPCPARVGGGQCGSPTGSLSPLTPGLPRMCSVFPAPPRAGRPLSRSLGHTLVLCPWRPATGPDSVPSPGQDTPAPPLSSCRAVGTELAFLAGPTMNGEGGQARSPLRRPTTNSKP